MSINRSLWKPPFQNLKTHNFHCPTCGMVTLSPAGKHALQKDEFSGSKKARADNEDWEPEWIQEGYVVKYTCSNGNCKEVTFSVGDISTKEEISDLDGMYPSREFIEWFSPLYFYGYLKPFHIHEKYSYRVRENIAKSFNLYWSNPAASLNSLRTAVEALMDQHEIRKTAKGKNDKKYILTLHNRIELFHQNGNPESGKQLMAIKWLGNAGSHGGTVVTHDDVLDAYEIFDHTTSILYPNTKLAKLVKNINNRKGPVR